MTKLLGFFLQLLEICTDKLGLSAAARRVFLDDGSEVFTAQEIPRDADIFLSMGEPFKDPFKGAKSMLIFVWLELFASVFCVYIFI